MTDNQERDWLPMSENLPRARGDYMTAAQFEARIAAILRRLHDLRAAARGEPTLRRVRVKAYDVSAHRVAAHDRYISARPRAAAVTRGKKAA
jgi:hypothetical protein